MVFNFLNLNLVQNLTKELHSDRDDNENRFNEFRGKLEGTYEKRISDYEKKVSCFKNYLKVFKQKCILFF